MPINSGMSIYSPVHNCGKCLQQTQLLNLSKFLFIIQPFMYFLKTLFRYRVLIDIRFTRSHLKQLCKFEHAY